MKQKFVLIVSLVAGLLAAILSKAWIDSREAEVKRKLDLIAAREERIEVLAAGRPLPAGTTIQQSDLGLITILASSVSDDSILKSDYTRIVGRKLVRSLDTRNPVLWSYIEGGKQAHRGLSDEIQQKMRAVSIPVSGAAGVSGMVRPSDCVDVLGSFALPSQNAAADAELEMVTLTVLQNVTVLAVGSDTQRTLGDARSASGYSTVTLQVTPREAEILVFAQQMRGKLFLTLRNKSDVYFENDLPRVDFNQIESELKTLNEYRQKEIRRVRTTY
ncbi:MAG: Flp pilus assembly protein CpaB [Kiritimatiellia bacterium]|jgi:pilus assembly protein CpaB